MKKFGMLFAMLLVVAFVGAFFPGKAFAAATYYVSPSGNDNNNGRSMSTPWKTLSKVNSFAFAPGDTVCFQRGGTWQGQLNITRSGTSGSPITYGAYGTGNLPVISGSNRTIPSNQGQGLINIGASNIVVDGLHSSYSGGYGIKIYEQSNVSIKNSEVENSNHGGIVFEGGSNALVDKCKVHHTNMAGVANRDAAMHEAISFANVNTFQAQNNEVYSCVEEGIDAKYGARNGIINGNTLYGNNGPQIYVDAAHHIDIYGNTTSGSAADKSGISIGVETTYNPGTYRKAEYITVRNNVIYGNAAGIILWSEPGAEAIHDIKIMNNTIIDNNKHNWGGIYFMSGQAGQYAMGGNVIRNNILYNNAYNNNNQLIGGARVIRDDIGAASYFTISHNMIRTGEPSDAANLNQVATSAPGFENAGIRDYHLTSGSPAINSGIDVGLPYNGTAPDMGAFEYEGTSVANMVLNPGFESGNASWAIWEDKEEDGGDDSNISGAVSSDAHSGVYSMRIGFYESFVSQDITGGFSVGSTYTISAWGKLSAPGESAWIGVKCFGNSDTLLREASVEFTTTAYTQKSTSFTVPANTVKLQVFLWRGKSEESNGTFFYGDDIDLR